MATNVPRTAAATVPRKVIFVTSCLVSVCTGVGQAGGVTGAWIHVPGAVWEDVTEPVARAAAALMDIMAPKTAAMIVILIVAM